MTRTLTLAFVLAGACAAGPKATTAESTKAAAPAPSTPQAASPLEKGQAEAIFAAGCFWCSEKDFEKLDGVIEVDSGYAGGSVANPTYKQVGMGITGHTEAVRVIYDPTKITYDALLDHYWHHVDPFDAKGQFCDRGSQYRPAIFPVDDTQRDKARVSKTIVSEKLGQPVVVKLETAGTFWVAEDYHQDFYKKSPSHYERYRLGCGRDARTKAIWAGK